MVWAPVNVTTGNLSSQMQIYYDKIFLEHEKEKVVMLPFADKKPLPKYSGKVIQWVRYRPLALVTTPLTTEDSDEEGSQSFESQNVSAEVSTWGKFTRLSTFLSMVAIDPELKALTELHGDQMGEAYDFSVMKEICLQGAFGRRADASTTYQIDTTVQAGTGTYASSTSLIFTEGWSAADDTHNNGLITCNSGTNYGWAGRTSASKAGDYPVVTVSPAAPAAFDATSGIRYANSSETKNTHILTSIVMRQALKDMLNNKPYMFNGWLNFVINPDVQSDLMDDTSWKEVQYRKPQGIKAGYIGDWFNMHVHLTTRPYKHQSKTGQTYSATGNTVDCPLMAMHSIGVTELSGQGNHIIVNPPIDPLKRQRTVGWKGIWVAKSLNACWALNIMCGYTGGTDE